VASSSSSCAFDLFNPDEALRDLPTLSVVDAGGGETAIPAGRVFVVGGANIELLQEADLDETTITATAGSGIEDPYFTQKFEALCGLDNTNSSGNPITGPFDPGDGNIPEGPSWSFTRNSMYIATINNAPPEPDTGTIFVVGDECTSVGTFEASSYPGYPHDPSTCSTGPCGAALSVLDICLPCVDCLEYYRLEEYLDRIKTFYDYIYNLSSNKDTGTPVMHPDGGTPETFSGVHPQMNAALRYWDYLVHTSTVKMSAQGQGQSVVFAAYYKNISNASVGPTFITFTLQFIRNDCFWHGVIQDNMEIRLLPREGVDSVTLTSVAYTTSSIIVTTESPGVVNSLGEVFCDFALLVEDAQLFDNDGNFRIDVTAEFAPTHIGTRERETTVYFKPPEIDSSSSGQSLASSAGCPSSSSGV
jgi:hypothetical protein